MTRFRHGPGPPAVRGISLLVQLRQYTPGLLPKLHTLSEPASLTCSPILTLQACPSGPGKKRQMPWSRVFDFSDPYCCQVAIQAADVELYSLPRFAENASCPPCAVKRRQFDHRHTNCHGPWLLGAGTLCGRLPHSFWGVSIGYAAATVR
jgi:hypothetical protein